MIRAVHAPGAQLTPDVVAPGKDVAEGVQRRTGHVGGRDRGDARQIAPATRRFDHDRRVVVLLAAGAQLALVIPAPGPDPSPSREREAAVCSRRDSRDRPVQFRDGERYRGILIVPLAELPRPVISPGKGEPGLDGRLMRPRGWMPLCRRFSRRPHCADRSDGHDSIGHFGPGAPYAPAPRYKHSHDLAPRIAPGQPAPGVSERNSGQGISWPVRQLRTGCSRQPELAGLFHIYDTIIERTSIRLSRWPSSWPISVAGSYCRRRESGTIFASGRFSFPAPADPSGW